MNPLQCGKDGSTSGTNKNYSVIDSIPSSFRIVKRSEQPHETISSIVGYKIGLPFLEMSDHIIGSIFLINGERCLEDIAPKSKLGSNSEFVIL